MNLNDIEYGEIRKRINDRIHTWNLQTSSFYRGSNPYALTTAERGELLEVIMDELSCFTNESCQKEEKKEKTQENE